MSDFEKDIRDISNKWFENGKKEEDVVYKFIAYWIAFNAVFCAHSDRQFYIKGGKSNNWPNEADQIKDLIDSFFDDKLKGCIDYDNAPECEIFKENPVFNGISPPHNSKEHYLRSNSEDYHIKNYQIFMKSGDEKERLKSLLLTIKQVRNNLFHGQKNPNPDRNYLLVDSSQKILKVILEALLEGES